jgi:hypothetical protein
MVLVGALLGAQVGPGAQGDEDLERLPVCHGRVPVGDLVEADGAVEDPAGEPAGDDDGRREARQGGGGETSGHERVEALLPALLNDAFASLS